MPHLTPHNLGTILDWVHAHADPELAAKCRAALFQHDKVDTTDHDHLSPFQVAERAVTPAWRAAHRAVRDADAALTTVFHAWVQRQLKLVREDATYAHHLHTWFSGLPRGQGATWRPSVPTTTRLFDESRRLPLLRRVSLLFTHGNQAEYDAVRAWQRARAHVVLEADRMALTILALILPGGLRGLDD